jgi:ribosomal protein S6--L-glutamate ligase
MAGAQKTFIVGWEEWAALPDLGLPAIKAKIDTGARTSALHAFLIEPFGPPSGRMVRFGIHPVPGRPDIEIYCSAPVIDRREVTSSNGERELRFVIRTRIAIGDREWPVDVTLTNREGMAYRMLIGRHAVREDMFVDPAGSFRQPRLSYKLYRHLPPQDPVRRPLRIALLTAKPRTSSNRQLAEAAQARGHVLERLDLARLALVHDHGMPGLAVDGLPLAHYDAVIPRVTPEDGPFGPAAVRQLELMGSFALNGGDALDRAANPFALQQALTRRGIPARVPAATGAAGEAGPRSGGARLRFLIVGDKVAAAVERKAGADHNAGSRKLTSERALAERAAAALGLGLAAIDVRGYPDEPHVSRVSAAPALGQIEQATGAPAAKAIIARIEARVRSWVQRTDPAPPPDCP